METQEYIYLIDKISDFRVEYQTFIDILKSLSEEKYREFTTKLTNGSRNMLGVKLPILKLLAKQIYKNGLLEDYVENCKFSFYEDTITYAFLISNVKDYKTFLKYLDTYVKQIDSWSLCDSAVASFKIISKNKEDFLNYIMFYINRNGEFEKRFALSVLLDHYIEEKYLSLIFDLSLKNSFDDRYYVKMMVAWLIATAFAKFRDQTLKFMTDNQIEKVTLKKTVSKICDSYRVTNEDKELIKKLFR